MYWGRNKWEGICQSRWSLWPRDDVFLPFYKPSRNKYVTFFRLKQIYKRLETCFYQAIIKWEEEDSCLWPAIEAQGTPEGTLEGVLQASDPCSGPVCPAHTFDRHISDLPSIVFQCCLADNSFSWGLLSTLVSQFLPAQPACYYSVSCEEPWERVWFRGVLCKSDNLLCCK